MAIQYESGLLNDFFRRSGQRRALTGLPTSYQEQRGLLDPMLAYNANMQAEADRRAKQMSIEQQRLDIAKDAQSTNQMAGVIGGVSQLSMLPMAYGAAKNMGWFGTPAQAQVVAPAVGSSPMASAPAYSGYGGGLLDVGGKAAGAPAASTGQGLLGTTAGAAGAVAGLGVGQYMSGKALQPTMDKAGMSATNKGWTYAGLPGAATGAVLDVVKKISSLF
jgi:hypothetical protein